MPRGSKKGERRGKGRTGQAFAKFGPEKRQEYLGFLAEGNSRATAAANVGVSRELVRLFRHANPGFVAEEEEAEGRAHGQVEDALFQAAVSGNVTACQVWLYNRRPERWKDQRNLKVTGLEDVLRSLPPGLAEATRRAIGETLPAGGGEDPGAGAPGD